MLASPRADLVKLQPYLIGHIRPAREFYADLDKMDTVL